ncbi:MAG: hypothetical protein AAGD13_01090 [Pseudomonadota bacterium]
MLEKLKEFRELIAILLFFTGGFIWIESRYAAKDDFDKVSQSLTGINLEMATRDDLKVMQCLLTEYMKLTQLQIRAQDIEKQVADLLESLKDPRLASNTDQLPPALKAVLQTHYADLDAKRAALNEVDVEMGGVRQKLERQECGAVQ